MDIHASLIILYHLVGNTTSNVIVFSFVEAFNRIFSLDGGLDCRLI